MIANPVWKCSYLPVFSYCLPLAPLQMHTRIPLSFRLCTGNQWKTFTVCSCHQVWVWMQTWLRLCRIRQSSWVSGWNHSLMSSGRLWGSDFIISCGQHEAIRKRSGEVKKKKRQIFYTSIPMGILTGCMCQMSRQASSWQDPKLGSRLKLQCDTRQSWCMIWDCFPSSLRACHKQWMDWDGITTTLKETTEKQPNTGYLLKNWGIQMHLTTSVSFI